MPKRRVVITGLGMLSPLGVGVNASWKNLIASKSGLVSTTTLSNSSEYEDIPSKVVGQVPRGPISIDAYDPNEHFQAHEIRRFSPFIQYSVVATKEALTDSNWFPTEVEDQIRTGTCIGSGIGSFEDIYNNAVGFANKGYKKIQPLFVPRVLTNMAAGNNSIKFGFKGPNHSVATACATGLHAVGDAARFIEDDYADVMVCGASEAALHPLSLGGFARARSVVTKYNEEPIKASRPFDSERGGFVLGEGAGSIVLESLDHALARGCKIYGEITGYGLSGDANHITTPSEDGEGARRAMEMALKRANLTPEDIGYVNAHATSTLLGDRAENFAMKTLFGKENPSLAVSSTKGSIGHLLGAAGAVELIFTIMALKNRILPPTLNCDNPGGNEEDSQNDFIFNYVANKAQVVQELNHVLCNSFGFGGTNASICVSKYVK